MQRPSRCICGHLGSRAGAGQAVGGVNNKLGPSDEVLSLDADTVLALHGGFCFAFKIVSYSKSDVYM